MKFSKLLFNREQTKAIAQKPVSIYPTDPTELADFLRDQLARHYRRRTSLVFQDNGISGKVPELYVAPRYVGLGVQLYNTRDLDKAMKLTRAVGLSAGVGDGSKDPPVESVLVGDLLVYRFVLPEYSWVRGQKVRLWSDVWLNNPALRGEMAVGLMPNGQPIYLELNTINPNYLVCGVQGSGKTELLKTMIYQITACNSRDAVKIAIVDIKSDFDEFRNEEHLIWQPAHTFEEAKVMILHFHAECERRKAAGLRDEPHWVLVVDEADHKQLALDEENQAHLLEVALRGRVYGMHLIIGTHRPDMDSVGDLGKELTIRFLGQQASAKDSGQVEGGLALHKLSGQGDFYCARGGGEPKRFQAARIPDDWYIRLGRDSHIPHPPVASPAPVIGFPTHERKAAHRPPFTIKMKDVAYYVLHGPDLVTVVQAKEVLGLSKDTGHPKTQQAAREFLTAWEQLQGSKISFNGKVEANG